MAKCTIASKCPAAPSILPKPGWAIAQPATRQLRPCYMNKLSQQGDPLGVLKSELALVMDGPLQNKVLKIPQPFQL